MARRSPRRPGNAPRSVPSTVCPPSRAVAAIGGNAGGNGVSERPSTFAGGVTPAQAAKVGARSMLEASSERVWPAGTSGPRITSGALMSVS